MMFIVRTCGACHTTADGLMQCHQCAAIEKLQRDFGTRSHAIRTALMALDQQMVDFERDLYDGIKNLPGLAQKQDDTTIVFGSPQ